MELERVKYMLKSYLRTRLFKIERNLFFVIEKDLANLLSESEIEYAWTLSENKKTLFNMGLFSKIPSSLNHFQKETLDDRLITKPNEKEFVFVRFLKDYSMYKLPNQIEMEIKKNCVYFLNYDQIKEFLEKGEAELL